MTLFKEFLKFFREWDCLREVGVSSWTKGPLYLNEFAKGFEFFSGLQASNKLMEWSTIGGDMELTKTWLVKLGGLLYT